MVNQGELLHGDANGVTNIPLELASEIADVSAESGIQVANPLNGRPMAKALAVVPRSAAMFSDTHTLAWLVSPDAVTAIQRALHEALVDS